MKKLFKIAIFAAIAITIAACDEKSKKDELKGKFHPVERTSSLSLADRDSAIEAMRQSLNAESTDSILLSNNVNFSVLPPAVSDNVSKEMSEKLANKLLLISSKNGIGGLSTNPVLALVAKVDCIDRTTTGTSPSKHIVKYNVTLFAGNTLTDDIYASTEQTITGVGVNFEDAASKAANELKNDVTVQKMLHTASERAIKWYENTSNIKNYVNKAVSEKKYALAMALLSSVPEEAKATFAYAVKRNEEVSNLLFQEKSAELLGGLEDAIAAAGDDYNPEIGAYLKCIPPRSSSYARAKKVYDEYIKKTRAVRDDARKKAHSEELERIALAKIKAPYEAKAALEEMRINAKLSENKIWADALVGAISNFHGIF